MPTDSSTARTGPPAMTPVPAAAGFSSTRPAPNRPMTACGIVVPFRLIVMHVLLGHLDPLPDRHRDFLRLAGAVADAPLPVADDHQRREGEVLAALDDLGHAVDVDDPVDQLASLRVALFLPFARRARGAPRLLLIGFPSWLSELQPPSRAASASSLTLPW